ncbi:hypothetical protein Ciccas_009398 [Cichlidogyrus casuarinus]|uniref:Uncharacterized protein n=1 Tax=Cichlidogyrus casuarinus TaxID=1844966 RepID=A0ABD2PX62_9PLAT
MSKFLVWSNEEMPNKSLNLDQISSQLSLNLKSYLLAPVVNAYIGRLEGNTLKDRTRFMVNVSPINQYDELLKLQIVVDHLHRLDRLQLTENTCGHSICLERAVEAVLPQRELTDRLDFQLEVDCDSLKIMNFSREIVFNDLSQLESSLNAKLARLTPVFVHFATHQFVKKQLSHVKIASTTFQLSEQCFSECESRFYDLLQELYGLATLFKIYQIVMKNQAEIIAKLNEREYKKAQNKTDDSSPNDYHDLCVAEREIEELIRFGKLFCSEIRSRLFVPFENASVFIRKKLDLTESCHDDQVFEKKEKLAIVKLAKIDVKLKLFKLVFSFIKDLKSEENEDMIVTILNSIEQECWSMHTDICRKDLHRKSNKDSNASISSYLTEEKRLLLNECTALAEKLGPVDREKTEISAKELRMFEYSSEKLQNALTDQIRKLQPKLVACDPDLSLKLYQDFGEILAQFHNSEETLQIAKQQQLDATDKIKLKKDKDEQRNRLKRLTNLLEQALLGSRINEKELNWIKDTINPELSGFLAKKVEQYATLVDKIMMKGQLSDQATRLEDQKLFEKCRISLADNALTTSMLEKLFDKKTDPLDSETFADFVRLVSNKLKDQGKEALFSWLDYVISQLNKDLKSNELITVEITWTSMVSVFLSRLPNFSSEDPNEQLQLFVNFSELASHIDEQIKARKEIILRTAEREATKVVLRMVSQWLQEDIESVNRERVLRRFIEIIKSISRADLSKSSTRSVYDALIEFFTKEIAMWESIERENVHDDLVWLWKTEYETSFKDAIPVLTRTDHCEGEQSASPFALLVAEHVQKQTLLREKDLVEARDYLSRQCKELNEIGEELEEISENVSEQQDGNDFEFFGSYSKLKTRLRNCKHRLEDMPRFSSMGMDDRRPFDCSEKCKSLLERTQDMEQKLDSRLQTSCIADEPKLLISEMVKAGQHLENINNWLQLLMPSQLVSLNHSQASLIACFTDHLDVLSLRFHFDEKGQELAMYKLFSRPISSQQVASLNEARLALRTLLQRFVSKYLERLIILTKSLRSMKRKILKWVSNKERDAKVDDGRQTLFHLNTQITQLLENVKLRVSGYFCESGSDEKMEANLSQWEKKLAIIEQDCNRSIGNMSCWRARIDNPADTDQMTVASSLRSSQTRICQPDQCYSEFLDLMQWVKQIEEIVAELSLRSNRSPPADVKQITDSLDRVNDLLRLCESRLSKVVSSATDKSRSYAIKSIADRCLLLKNQADSIREKLLRETSAAQPGKSWMQHFLSELDEQLGKLTFPQRDDCLERPLRFFIRMNEEMAEGGLPLTDLRDSRMRLGRLIMKWKVAFEKLSHEKNQQGSHFLDSLLQQFLRSLERFNYQKEFPATYEALAKISSRFVSDLDLTPRMFHSPPYMSDNYL